MAEFVFEPMTPHLPRSPEVRAFLETHPELDIPTSLTFLTEHYPDTDEWLINGGIAVQAHTVGRTQVPRDIDIISRDPAMEEDFGEANAGLDPTGIHYIDVKSVNKWLIGRGAGVDPETAWEYLLRTSNLMDIGGSKVRVMHPAIVAAEKTEGALARMSTRDKDTTDLELLAVSPEQLAAATALLRGQDPEEQIKTLMLGIK